MLITKEVLTCLFFLFISINSRGDIKLMHEGCREFGLTIWPKSATIKTNSIFLIEGYAASEEIINGLNTKYPVYLKSENHQIKLNVKERNKGFNLTQALLLPEVELRSGEVYEFVIENCPNREKPLRKPYNEKLGVSEDASWKVIDSKDVVKPKWKSRPVEINRLYGFSTMVTVVFSGKAVDESELWVLASMKSLETGKTSKYIIPIENSEIKLKSHICSGVLYLSDREFKKYEVKFSLLDASGNLTAWVGNPLMFSSWPLRTK